MPDSIPSTSIALPVATKSTQNNRLYAIAILIALLTACGGGSGDAQTNGTVGNPVFGDVPTDNTVGNPISGDANSPENVNNVGENINAGGANNRPNSSNTANSSATAVADPALISTTDSSLLRNAVASGQDLARSLLSTDFFCHAKGAEDIANTFVTITIDGTQYTTRFNGEVIQAGEWVYLEDDIFEFIAPEESSLLRLELTPYGQVLHFEGDRDREVADSCYQQGAAHEFVLHRYELNRPELASYQCQLLETGQSAGVASLHADGVYDVNGSSGGYRVTGIVSTDDEDVVPELVFDSGPFAGTVASYAEFPNSGYQEMFFEETSSSSGIGLAGSRSEAQMRCFRARTPRPFKQYGSTLAETPAAPVIALAGLHAIDTSVRTSSENTNTILYMDFRPNGYVYTDTPFPGGADCSLTTPAGLPYCDTYQFDGSVLTLNPAGGGEPETVQVQTAAGATLVQFDGYPVEAVTAANVTSLTGDWEYENTVSGSLSLCIVGFCSGSVLKVGITFNNDGTFTSDSDSFGFSSSNFVNVSSLSQSRGSSFMSGTYALNGMFLTMTFSNGHSNTQLAHFGFDNSILALGDRGFRLQ